jgi:hypothetical protein
MSFDSKISEEPLVQRLCRVKINMEQAITILPNFPFASFPPPSMAGWWTCVSSLTSFPNDTLANLFVAYLYEYQQPHVDYGNVFGLRPSTMR